MSMYVEDGYVLTGYFEDEPIGLPGTVKIFGQDLNKTINPTVDDDSSAIIKRFESKFDKKAISFPFQKIGI